MYDVGYVDSTTELAYSRVRGDFLRKADVGELTRTRVHDRTVGAQFRKLEKRWKRETMHISSLDERYGHRSYRQIIGLGPDVIPFILESLRTEPDYWFYALRLLTGEDPVSPSAAGRMRKMADAWLKWGRSHGYEAGKAR